MRSSRHSQHDQRHDKQQAKQRIDAEDGRPGDLDQERRDAGRRPGAHLQVRDEQLADPRAQPGARRPARSGSGRPAPRPGSMVICQADRPMARSMPSSMKRRRKEKSA